MDFVDRPATDLCLDNKTQLIHPGQYVKVVRNLPLPLYLEFMAIGDKQGIQITKKLEKVVVTEGSWGNAKKAMGKLSATLCILQGLDGTMIAPPFCLPGQMKAAYDSLSSLAKWNLIFYRLGTILVNALKKQNFPLLQVRHALCMHVGGHFCPFFSIQLHHACFVF